MKRPMKRLILSFACATAVLAGCSPKFEGQDVVVVCDTPSSSGSAERYENVQTTEKEDTVVIKEANGNTHTYPKAFCSVL